MPLASYEVLGARAAHAAAGSGRRICPESSLRWCILWTGGYHAQGPVDAHRPDRRRVVACASAVRERVASPLRTLANLLEAMREGDYSIRARGAAGRTRLAK